MDENKQVNELAEKLLAQGLAHSKMRAMELASDISSTNGKVRKELDDRQKVFDKDEAKQAVADEMRRNALQGKPVDIQTDYEVPGFSKDTPIGEMVQDDAVEEAEEEISEVPEKPDSVDLSDVFNFSS